MDKTKYPPQKCKCGAKAYLDSIVINCNRQYQYIYRCIQCKRRMITKGPTQEQLLGRPKKEALLEYARNKTCNI